MSLLSKINTTKETTVYTTSHGLRIARRQTPLPMKQPVDLLLEKLDDYKGGLFSSTYEFPGRYSRWDIGFYNPPIELTAKKQSFRIRALNARGRLIIAYLTRFIDHPAIELSNKEASELTGTIISHTDGWLKEENRTRRPSIFTLLRQIKALINTDDEFLGLYGAFGYDLIYQFEHLPICKDRDSEQNDLQLYLPDELFVVDHEKNEAYRLTYEFFDGRQTTEGMTREPSIDHYRSGSAKPSSSGQTFADKKGDYAELVRKAKEAFKKGDLFEVVPSRVLSRACESKPTRVFRRLQQINPSPYGFLLHLNNGEFLVGSSPEMFVRVDGATVETCPISGTIRRIGSVIEDAEQIKTLLGSSKDESELTMCTDVDRNDKSRVCVPGSVEVVGRRQIEAYSHLFHTVDHIRGKLKSEFDALDAFMTHMWAVTVTGAPKREAMAWIEKHEKAPRNWYGGAVGWFGFNGNLNTGLTLRTLRLQNGIATIRAGATLLYDSVPDNEERETLTKAEALLEALGPDKGGDASRPAPRQSSRENSRPADLTISGMRLLLVDHEDSFVHTLSSYFQTLGANVTVCRSPVARQIIESGSEPVDLVILSPGPGEPDRFRMDETIRLCLNRKLPLFGICLGLQGIVRYFGGSLRLLPVPAHGKSSVVIHENHSRLFRDVPKRFRAGRYHSIHAGEIPDVLNVSARTEEGVIMAVEHRDLPIAAVQFHPESIMTMKGGIGLKILENVLRMAEMQPAAG